MVLRDSREARPGSLPLGGPASSPIAADRRAFWLTAFLFGCNFEQRASVCNNRATANFSTARGIFIYNCNLFLARDGAQSYSNIMTPSARAVIHWVTDIHIDIKKTKSNLFFKKLNYYMPFVNKFINTDFVNLLFCNEIERDYGSRV